MTSQYAMPEEVTQHVGSINLVAFLSFFIMQILLVQRLVRKNYRSFRICVVHDDGQQSRTMSVRQTLLVGFCVVGFQVGFIMSLLLIAILSGATIGRAVLALEVWLRFFVAGPYSIALALRVRYPGFQLQASGLRYI
jgi:hypothetical protein